MTKAKPNPKPAPKRYRAVVDLYDAENTLIASAGEVVPPKKIEKSLPWLLEQGLITEEVG